MDAPQAPAWNRQCGSFAFALPPGWRNLTDDELRQASDLEQTRVWAGAISEPLSASVEGGRATLKGVFGVFTPGTAEAGFYNNMGEELSRETLQAVDPREVFRLDKAVPAPQGAFRVSVRVLDADGENRGYLGNVILK